MARRPVTILSGDTSGRGGKPPGDRRGRAGGKHRKAGSRRRGKPVSPQHGRKRKASGPPPGPPAARRQAPSIAEVRELAWIWAREEVPDTAPEYAAAQRLAKIRSSAVEAAVDAFIAARTGEDGRALSDRERIEAARKSLEAAVAGEMKNGEHAPAESADPDPHGDNIEPGFLDRAARKAARGCIPYPPRGAPDRFRELREDAVQEFKRIYYGDVVRRKKDGHRYFRPARLDLAGRRLKSWIEKERKRRALVETDPADDTEDEDNARDLPGPAGMPGGRTEEDAAPAPDTVQYEGIRPLGGNSGGLTAERARARAKKKNLDRLDFLERLLARGLSPSDALEKARTDRRIADGHIFGRRGRTVRRISDDVIDERPRPAIKGDKREDDLDRCRAMIRLIPKLPVDQAYAAKLYLNSEGKGTYAEVARKNGVQPKKAERLVRKAIYNLDRILRDEPERAEPEEERTARPSPGITAARKAPVNPFARPARAGGSPKPRPRYIDEVVREMKKEARRLARPPKAAGRG